MYGLAAILILGIGAQWLAWRLRLPSILLLLLFGFIAGPVTHFINPNALFGELLLPIVSLSVALILFEGGMSLRMRELRQVGHVVRNLVSVGMVITGVLTAIGAHFLAKLPWPLAALLASILVVTGPTVIGPLLRHVRPSGQVGPILKWEGIAIDPIGALLAVLVYEVIRAGELRGASPVIAVEILKTIFFGGSIGLFAGFLLTFLLRRLWIPDYLQSPVTLMTVAGVYVLRNWMQPESGLFAVTVMGLTLANQKWVPVHHIAEFKENLTVLLISGLFIVLAARLNLENLSHVSAGALVFVVVLIVVVRPLAVALSTLGSSLTLRERTFLALMAPRGIVAAAVSSVFAIRLREANVAGADLLVPVTFLVIIATVTLYGGIAAPLARWLGLARPGAQGFLIVGAHEFARSLASLLVAEGYVVLLVDTNRANLNAARLDGLPTLQGSALSPMVAEQVELTGIGRLLAMTPNDEVNSLAVLHFARVFGRSEVYQLAAASAAATPDPKKQVSQQLRGRLLFAGNATFAELAKRVERGAVVKKTTLTAEFDLDAYTRLHEGQSLPLMVLDPSGALTVMTGDNPPVPQVGQTIIALMYPASESIEARPAIAARG